MTKIYKILSYYRLLIAVFLLSSACLTLAAPAVRTVDNTINSFEKVTNQNMPHHVRAAFPNLMEITKKLTRLYTNGNQMRITADVFANADELEMINLSDGDIMRIDSRAFYGTPKLKKLDLSNNKLTSLPVDLFPQRNALKEIDLSDNKISTLNRNTFRSLQHLKKLDLRNNQITQLSGLVFADLIGLEELDLSGNPIQSISEDFLASLPNGLALSFDDQNLDFKSLKLTEQWAL